MREFLIDKVIIRKWTNVSGTNKHRVRSTATVDGSLQQLSRENAERLNGVMGRDYVMYMACDDVTVTLSEGDQFKLKDGGDIFAIKLITP